MPYKFTDPAPYAYAPGKLFLGLDPETNREIGIETERNAITVAGPGTGKGAALIIQNLKRWPHAALVIDPKGENAEETWKARQALGQKVGVLDPFNEAKVPKRLRVSINPLALFKPDKKPNREDILAIADGIVKRTDPEAAQWDDGARTIIAGVIAYVVAEAPEEHRTLATARRLLLQPNKIPVPDGEPPAGLYADAQRMVALGGLAQAAGVSIMTAIEKERGADTEYLSGARRHSEWLDSEEIAETISSTSFKLSDLAKGKATLFLVLPYKQMELYSPFLRLLVRTAQNMLASAGNKRGADERCLFILDEFFTLGRIDEIAKAAGNMRSYGLQLWPFLQDLGQLFSLYGENLSATFFSGADAHVFFGVTDSITLNYISSNIGRKTADDIGVLPPPMVDSVPASLRAQASAPLMAPRPMVTIPHRKLGALISVFGGGINMGRNFIHSADMADQSALRAQIEQIDRAQQVQDTNAMRAYTHASSARGEPRLTPDEVRDYVQKPDGAKVARSMIVFAKGRDILNLALIPFFELSPSVIPTLAERQFEERKMQIKYSADSFQILVQNEKALNDKLARNIKKIS